MSPTERSPYPPYPEASVVPPDAPPRQPEEWDAVDEASWESFPASDPPSYTPQHASTEPPSVEEGASVAEAPTAAATSPPLHLGRSRAERRARMFKLAGVTVALAAGAIVWRRRRRRHTESEAA